MNKINIKEGAKMVKEWGKRTKKEKIIDLMQSLFYVGYELFEKFSMVLSGWRFDKSRGSWYHIEELKETFACSYINYGFLGEFRYSGRGFFIKKDC